MSDFATQSQHAQVTAKRHPGFRGDAVSGPREVERSGGFGGGWSGTEPPSVLEASLTVSVDALWRFCGRPKSDDTDFSCSRPRRQRPREYDFEKLLHTRIGTRIAVRESRPLR